MRAPTIVLLLIAAPVVGQVEARQVSKEEARAIANAPETGPVGSPMLLTVPFATKGGTSAFEVFRLGSKRWGTEETAGFVIDKAHVLGVEVTREGSRKDRMKLRIATPVATDWFRQDINYTLAFLAGGEPVKSRTWEKLTIGSPASAAVWGGATTRTQELELDYTLDEWKAIEAKGDHKIRMVIEIVDD